MLRNLTSSKATLVLARAFLNSIPSRQFFFTFTALVVWSAKIVHIHAHVNAVNKYLLHRWGYSFVAQDVAVLTLIRLILDQWSTNLPTLPRLQLLFLNAIFMLLNAGLAVTSISFYLVAGSEIHLSNISLPTDPSSKALMLSGSLAFTTVICVTVLLSWLLQVPCYSLHGYAAEVVNWTLAVVWRLVRRVLSRRTQYIPVPQPKSDIEHQLESFEDDESWDDSIGGPKQQALLQPRVSLSSALRSAPYIATAVFLLMLLFAALARPSDRSLIFLSWTAALAPLVDFASGPTLQDLPSVYGTGIQRDWDDRSALTNATSFDWLPGDRTLSGFEDWHYGRYHYTADADPLKISNLHEDLVPALKDKLQDIPIKHVILCFLESTRNDVFPIKKDEMIWERLASTFPDGELPRAAQDRLASLTPTANYITGDYDDGFEHDEASKLKRGGIHFTNAHTTGTFTFKSLVGTLCGIGPLLADFNADYSHHIYQPCLAQIFEAMNHLPSFAEQGARTFTTSKWQSYFYSAAALEYDKQHELMLNLGFPEEHLIGQEWLRSSNATHGPVTLPNINAFAFEEDPLLDYFRDVFVNARETDERVFLSHITTTSHHAYKMPSKEEYVPLANGLDMLSRYVNTEGYDDRWLRKILDLLDEQGVANETLIVFVGDHGISMPENDAVSPYYNPSIGIDHVPLVLSHPLLPSFDIHDAVHSSQILPTILDLLLETDSLNNASHRAVSDLVRNYEGQSLIRPLLKSNEKTGQGNWQFVVVNPGRAMVTGRDARHPERHLTVPIIDNVEWRLSNTTADPAEHDSVQGFDFVSFLNSVEQKHGLGVAKWVEEGAFIARWWTEENHKRWRFGPYFDNENDPVGDEASGDQRVV
ncbi:lipoteichoic acid synthase yvgj [Fusarium albosuccineum]|uniref:Lipoteichoic acid synthase yvgj n=1 Tax=Fusarium albosuccineum TaxID=1237068 RepID=A0A8H4KZ57_9HYPO|nr:lipoteichoic acid synthase yvgj [Fusarium albosuccineum]